MTDMRLLVCGGRGYDDVPRLWSILDGINKRRIDLWGNGVRCLIDGGQEKKLDDERIVGAAYWAHQWALARGTPTERYFADWDGQGKSAGPIRNKRMMFEGKPTHGLVMPGGRGTAHMLSIMQSEAIPVMVIT